MFIKAAPLLKSRSSHHNCQPHVYQTLQTKNERRGLCMRQIKYVSKHFCLKVVCEKGGGGAALVCRVKHLSVTKVSKRRTCSFWLQDLCAPTCVQWGTPFLWQSEGTCQSFFFRFYRPACMIISETWEVSNGQQVALWSGYIMGGPLMLGLCILHTFTGSINQDRNTNTQFTLCLSENSFRNPQGQFGAPKTWAILVSIASFSLKAGMAWEWG